MHGHIATGGAEVDTPAPYLYHLAAHLEDPSAFPFEALADALGAGRSDEALLDRLRAWVDALRGRDPLAWCSILDAFASHPARLAEGIGARLKALSPFAGRALATVEFRDGIPILGGDVDGFLESLLGGPVEHGKRYLVALDPSAPALVVQARSPKAREGEGR